MLDCPPHRGAGLSALESVRAARLGAVLFVPEHVRQVVMMYACMYVCM